MSISRVIVILDNLRSAYNVGSVFRTADGAGVAHICLCGTTPTPIDRFGRPQPTIAKTALGTEHSVSWEYCPSTQELLAKLSAQGTHIIAVEQVSRAIDYRTFVLPSHREAAFLFGEETKGIPEHTLSYAHDIIMIPMLGAKESLNVSVAAGIILFHTLQQ